MFGLLNIYTPAPLAPHTGYGLRATRFRAHGGQRKALKAANTARTELKELLDGSRLVNGKLSKTTIGKAKKLLCRSN